MKKKLKSNIISLHYLHFQSHKVTFIKNVYINQQLNSLNSLRRINKRKKKKMSKTKVVLIVLLKLPQTSDIIYAHHMSFA